MLSLRWDYWKEYKLNGIGVNIVKDSHRHRWQVWFHSMHEGKNYKEFRKPDIELTNKEGLAVLRVLDDLKQEREQNAKE